MNPNPFNYEVRVENAVRSFYREQKCYATYDTAKYLLDMATKYPEAPAKRLKYNEAKAKLTPEEKRVLEVERKFRTEIRNTQ